MCLFNLLAPASSQLSPWSSTDPVSSSLLPIYKSCMVPCSSCPPHYSYPLIYPTCSPTMPPHHSCKLTAPAWTPIDPTSHHTLHQITIVLRVFLYRLAFTYRCLAPLQWRPYFVWPCKLVVLSFRRYFTPVMVTETVSLENTQGKLEETHMTVRRRLILFSKIPGAFLFRIFGGFLHVPSTQIYCLTGAIISETHIITTTIHNTKRSSTPSQIQGVQFCVFSMYSVLLVQHLYNP
jgi:hypothetical protein